MPAHPSEEQTESGIFDKVAQATSDNQQSTASDHPIHDTRFRLPGEESTDKHADAKKDEFVNVHSSKGPQISDQMPEKASKEELKAKVAELNK